MEGFQHLRFLDVHFFVIDEQHERFAKRGVGFQRFIDSKHFQLFVRFYFSFVLDELFYWHLDHVRVVLVFSEVSWPDIL